MRFGAAALAGASVGAAEKAAALSLCAAAAAASAAGVTIDVVVRPCVVALPPRNGALAR